jgi:ubiquinone/menaquinone biosynthesis C-methylase UbiE
MTFQLAGSAAEIYEKVMVPLWFGRWAEALVERLALRPGETVLDVACGTGVTTRLAHRQVAPEGRVTGLDLNAAMLAKARELAAGQDIAWLEADACDSGLGSATVDVVMSQHGYHYFPDKPGALREFRRVLVPGGRMALSIWDGHSPYTRAVCAAVERHISPEIARRQRSQRMTPSATELADQLRGAGFSDVRVERQELAISVPPAREFVPLHLGSMPIAGAYHALPDDRKRALIDDVENDLGAWADGGRLVYPDAVHVAMATG